MSSSQNTVCDLVSRVHGWGEGEAKERAPGICPPLLEFLEQEGNEDVKVQVIQTLFEICLHHIAIEEAEEKVLRRGLASLAQLFEQAVAEVNMYLGTEEEMDSDSVSAVVEVMYVLLQSVESCCRYASKFSELAAVQISSLARWGPHILLTAVNHCRESVDMYAGLEDLIRNLFGKCQVLQASLLDVLEKVTFNCSFEDDMELLIQVCKTLSQIGGAMMRLDVKSMSQLWKSFIAIIKRYSEDLKSVLDVSPTLQLLSEDIALRLNSPNDSVKAAVADAKIANFSLKIAVALCQLFQDYLPSQNLPSLIDLLLQLNRFGSSKRQDANYAAALDSMSAGTYALLETFADQEEFRQAIFSKAANQKQELNFATCELMLIILSRLTSLYPEQRQPWILQDNFIELMFIVVAKCRSELCADLQLPGVMPPGKPRPMVSMYENVCTRLSGLAATLDAREFSVLEKVLLDNLTQPHLWNATLAMDVWCFIARYGSSSMCLQHASILARWIQDQGESNLTLTFIHVSKLLRRILMFLSDEDKEKFLELFPPRDFVHIWHVTGFNMLDAVQRNVVEQEVKQLALGYANRLESLPLFLKAAVVVTDEDIARELVRTWGRLRVQRASEKDGHRTINMMIQATRMALPHLTAVQFFQVVMKLSSCLRFLDRICKVSSTFLLKDTSGISFPPWEDQLHLLRCLSDMFATLLGDPDPLVQEAAIEALEAFSRATAHTAVIKDAVRDNAVKGKVAKYVQRVKYPCVPPFRKTLALGSGSFVLPSKEVKNAPDKRVPQLLHKLRQNSTEAETIWQHFSDQEKEEYVSIVNRLTSVVV